MTEIESKSQWLVQGTSLVCLQSSTLGKLWLEWSHETDDLGHCIADNLDP